MNDLDLFHLAVALGKVVHAGQIRKGTGEPYVNHLLRVASQVHSTREKTLAYLHDTVEDTLVTYSALREIGFPEDIVDDVAALSRRHTEPYFDFIQRTICDGSNDALRVKLADLADNLSDKRSDGSLKARYIKSDLMIRAALEREVT